MGTRFRTLNRTGTLIRALAAPLVKSSWAGRRELAAGVVGAGAPWRLSCSQALRGDASGAPCRVVQALRPTVLGRLSQCLERRSKPRLPLLPLPPPRHWVPQLPLFWFEVGPGASAERGRGICHLSSCGRHHRCRLVPLPGLGLCPKTALCPCLPQSLAALLSASFFFRPCLSTSVSLCLSLCLSVSLCSLSFWPCLSVSPSAALSTRLCPSASVSVSLCVCLSFPLHLSTLCVSLYKCLSLSLSRSPPSHPPVLFLFSSLLPLGGCSSPTRPAWGHLRALPRVHFPVTSTCPSPRRGLRLPSAAVGRGGGAREGRHSAQHLLGSPGAPDPLCSY